MDRHLLVTVQDVPGKTFSEKTSNGDHKKFHFKLLFKNRHLLMTIKDVPGKIFNHEQASADDYKK